MQPIKTLDEAVTLLNSPEELEKYLRARLLLLAGEAGASAVRAIELLRSLPPRADGDGLGDVSTDALLEAERRADEFIKRIDGESRFSQDTA